MPESGEQITDKQCPPYGVFKGHIEGEVTHAENEDENQEECRKHQAQDKGKKAQ